MNLHLYIPPHSAHPKGVLKSLVFGTLQRYWSQNMDRNVFIDTTRAFYRHLQNRGYTPQDLDQLFYDAASTIDRRHSIPLCPHTTTPADSPPNSGTRLFLHWEYHPPDISRRSIRDAYSVTLGPALSTSHINVTQSTLAYHNPRSLRNCLAKTQLQEPSGAQASDHMESLEQPPPANL
jgi:hypothetical protein